VNCETDFVAKNEKFKAFVQTLAERAAGAELNLAEAAATEITAKIAEIGENIVVRRNLRYAVQETGRVAAYIHHGSTIGVLLEAACQKTETTEKPGVPGIDQGSLSAYRRIQPGLYRPAGCAGRYYRRGT